MKSSCLYLDSDNKCSNKSDFCKKNNRKCYKMYIRYKTYCDRLKEGICELQVTGVIDKMPLSELKKYVQEYKETYDNANKCYKERLNHRESCIEEKCRDQGHLFQIQKHKEISERCNDVLIAITKRIDSEMKDIREKEDTIRKLTKEIGNDKKEIKQIIKNVSPKGKKKKGKKKNIKEEQNKEEEQDIEQIQKEQIEYDYGTKGGKEDSFKKSLYKLVYSLHLIDLQYLLATDAEEGNGYKILFSQIFVIKPSYLRDILRNLFGSVKTIYVPSKNIYAYLCITFSCMEDPHQFFDMLYKFLKPDDIESLSESIRKIAAELGVDKSKLSKDYLDELKTDINEWKFHEERIDELKLAVIDSYIRFSEMIPNLEWKSVMYRGKSLPMDDVKEYKTNKDKFLNKYMVIKMLEIKEIDLIGKFHFSVDLSYAENVARVFVIRNITHIISVYIQMYGKVFNECIKPLIGTEKAIKLETEMDSILNYYQ